MATRQVSRDRVIAVPAQRVFDVLADPRKHPLISGDRTVKAAKRDVPERLAMGSIFRMRIHLFIPYWITNEVIEFEEGRVIAWRHYAGHVWRWRTDPRGADRCLVMGTFDYSTTLTPLLFEIARVPAHNRRNLRRSLENLARLAGE